MTTNLPFSPRPLSKSELDRHDIYMTAKPGTGDIVSLVDPLRLAQWLLLIFDPAHSHCVERPRQLTLYHDTTVELDFWTRRRDGAEMFWVLVPEGDAQSTPTGRVHRDAGLWAQATQSAGIPLTFVFERELLHLSQRVANYFRLLPHAQAGYQLPDAALMRGRVEDLFGSRLPLTFEQIELTLQDLDQASVRSTLCTFIYEGRLTFPVDLPLVPRTVLTWEGRA